MSVFEHFDGFYEIDPRQRLMLQALVLGAPRDRECFSRWLADVDFDTVDRNAWRLIPALFGKFGDATRDEPRMEKLKGAYRYAQFRNSILLADGRRAMRKLRNAGIDLLLFKGIALTLKYHGNIAVRPMGDVDVLVRPESVYRAEKTLLGLGWRYVYPDLRKSADVHSHDYVNARRSGFDLHWYSLYESPIPGIDEGIWRRALPFDWDGLDVKLMAPEDLLLTGIVNGLRTGDALSMRWIHDVARIVSAEPAIAWSIVRDEATGRGLRQTVLEALKLVRSVSSELMPDSLLQSFDDTDPAIRQGDRTRGADREIADVRGSPGHVHFSLNEKRRIDRLYLQSRHLPLLADLFDVRDPAGLQAIVAKQLGAQEGSASIPSGLLAIKSKPDLRTYGARIVVADGLRKLDLAAGESRRIHLEIENDSPCCWAVSAGSNAPFSASYHLFSPDGKVLVWDFPRTYLVLPRRGCVAFIEPGQKVVRDLSIVAPHGPGRYVVRLDLVQESVSWFSDRGCQFPEIELEVRKRRPVGHCAVSASGIVHETANGETVIIDTVNGNYYTAAGYGAAIWNAIMVGHDTNAIVAALAAAGVPEAGDKIVEPFIDALLDEGLIVPCEREPQLRDALRVEALPGLQFPNLVKHGEAKELIAMNPLGEAGAPIGWPYHPAADPPEEGPGSEAAPR